jgi:UDP-N-acetylmuramyl tripeptide synthase
VPDIDYYPYLGPNRRSDKTVVEITLDFESSEHAGFPRHSSEIRDLLVGGGVLTSDEAFPLQTLPDNSICWYASLLAQTALLLQSKAGHRVDFFSITDFPEKNRCRVLLEHEHCDVGITAVKLANELLTGQRKQLAGPFGMFKAFAHDRRLPLDTEAIIKAARNRDIPCNHLERFPRMRNANSECIRRNGLLLLGHGKNQQVLDGTFCPGKSGEFRSLLKNGEQRRALIEKTHVEDDGEYHVLAVNNQVLAVLGMPARQSLSPQQVHPSILDAVLKINRAVGMAPVVASIKSGEVLDFELAPNLEYFQPGDSALLELAAEATLDWLFPGKTTTRMPAIAITGTNGKTTTSRMVNHILLKNGRKPGLVCTDGIFLNGHQVNDVDNCTMKGHFDVLSSPEVDYAVLETHHYGILVRGFAFRWCDIAVCLNVTEDHLGVVHIDTVEQMANAKGSLLERAKYAVVINADDPLCLAMLDSVTAEKVCLVSMDLGVDELGVLAGDREACYCVSESIDGEERLLIYNDGLRLPVIPAAGIPATFNTTARFNVSNAMHAIAATFVAGIKVEAIAGAMACFTSDYASTPGRLNHFDDLPFRIIMDFAHNPDGFARLCDFVDQQDVTGRKLIAFAGSVDRKDDTLIKMGRAMAGHFDIYFCKEYPPREDREPRKVAQLLQQGLMEAGVEKQQTAIKGSGRDVIFEIFDSCKAGDLLVMAMGHAEKLLLPTWIIEYSNRTARCD